jgi:hypothetical protein
MNQLVLISLAVAFVITSLAYLAINKSRRDVVLDRLRMSRRRVSFARTPPRSLSPEKRLIEEVSYMDTFPPSRRCSLKDIKFATKLKKSSADITASPADSRTTCAPFTESIYNLETPAYTCTEFSSDEIKALGDFPDYAMLSGVPLPQPYHEFRIETAKPRPYRPLRWAYHQTMCKQTPLLA